MRTMETARLRLRPLTDGDDAFILRLLNEPAYLEHIGDKAVRSLDDARTYVEMGPRASYEAHGFGLDCVELKASGEPIGMCGLLKRDVLDDVDVGYAFLSGFWSRGYAGEALAAVLADAKTRLRLTRIAAVVSGANDSSIRLLQKFGFRYEKMVSLYEGDTEVRLYVTDL
jgi:[ribosomal protein S5]-alanine N-acetyltransferase